MKRNTAPTGYLLEECKACYFWKCPVTKKPPKDHSCTYFQHKAMGAEGAEKKRRKMREDLGLENIS